MEEAPLSPSVGALLVDAAAELDKLPGPLGNDQAARFLAEHPLSSVFSILSSEAPLPRADVALIRTALRRVLQTEHASALQPEVAQYAQAALQSPQPDLRALGCEQLGRLLEGAGAGAGAAGGDAGRTEVMATALLGALRDADTGVAAAARKALLPYVESEEGLNALLDPSTACGRKLTEVSNGGDATARMRVLQLVAEAAGSRAAVAERLRSSGVVHVLLRELDDPSDPLSSLAGLQLVSELAEQRAAGLATALLELLQPQLQRLIADPYLRPSVLLPVARLLGAALLEGSAEMDVDGPSYCRPVLDAIKGALDEQGDAGAQEEAAALDAVGQLGLSRAGAELIVRDTSHVIADVASRAFGLSPTPEVRLAALHALASIAGHERAGKEAKRAAALLSDEAEDTLRVAIYDACGPRLSPTDVLLRQLQQPFPEARVAAYRLAASLALRPWFAATVVKHDGLWSRVLDPRSEEGRQGSEWRYAFVLALFSTQKALAGEALPPPGHRDGAHAAALHGAAGSLEAAVKGGPYGSGLELVAGRGEHLVATLGGS